MFSVLSAALLSFSLAARADTFETLDLNATLTNGGTVTGTVTLDLNADLSRMSPALFESSANLTYTFNGASSVFSGDNRVFSGTPNETGVTFFNAGGDQLNLDWETSLFASFAGSIGNFCTIASPCDGIASSLYLPSSRTEIEIASATVAPAATPEPSSLALLGTGVLGFAGVLRKRFA